MSPPLTDTAAADLALCRRMATADPTAGAELVAHYGGLVFALARRLLVDPQEAEDLTQEALLQVYLRAGEFRGEARLATWIYRVTYNLGLNYRRDLKRERTELVATPADLAPAVEEAPGHHLDVFAALGTLSQHDQAILTLHYVHEQSLDEIGAILEASTGAVKVRLFRARERLRASLTTNPEEVAS